MWPRRLLVLASTLVVPALAWAADSSALTATDTSWVGRLPYVTNITTIPAHPRPYEETQLLIEGRFPNDCGELLGGGEGVSVWIQPLANCDSLGPIPIWSRAFDLGQLASGRHSVLITLRINRDDATDDPLVYTDHFEFFVARDSTSIGPLPYVDQITIGPAHRGGVFDPICEGDGILVSARGHFPNACHRLIRIDLLPSPLGSPLPEPPVVRFVVDRGECLDMLCPQVITPWESNVLLPPLPMRDYRLIAELAISDCADSFRVVGPVHSTTVPFSVQSCPPERGCLVGDWAPGDDRRCNGHLSPQGRAEVSFAIRSDVALAGLQGTFSVDNGKLRIAGIEAIGPAQGMHVVWRPTDIGARFTLFADHGAPIPASSTDSLNPGGNAVPILRLTLERIARELPPVTFVFAGELLGSDDDGNAVPECWIETMVPPLVAVAARICTEAGCDFNVDGATDIRDIVLMARCVLGTATDSTGNTYRQMCADSAAVADCNADGRKDIADVICCAIQTLRDSNCPECPADTSTAIPAPNVRVALQAPVFDETGAELTVDLQGLGGVGGLVMRFDYPADRYTAEIVPGAFGRGWLQLSDVLDGTATIGLVNAYDPLAPYTLDEFQAPTRIKLTLKPGQRHGGVVKLSDIELSDPTGAKLLPPTQSVTASLGGPVLLALSEARPNPAARVTQFGLTLDRPSTVSVSIYDLSGRLVSTLHRGPLGAGSHDFTWNGVSDQGTAAPGGVYFYRASTDGAIASRKLVLLGR